VGFSHDKTSIRACKLRRLKLLFANLIVAIITDEDGYTKAQSKAVSKDEAFKIFDKLVQDGMPEFAGDAVEIWTERYPKVARN